ncbi:MAG TPA: hypothetical protein VFJ06_02270 [Halococcus sp.]|nr:hypothetical protein [Halococcus sp.]
MSEDTTYPEPADHGRTIPVGEYDLAPGAKLSRASMGPIGAGEYSSFIVLDTDPDAGELDLYRVTDGARRTVSAAGLEGDIGQSTFVIDTGVDDDENTSSDDDTEE